MAMLDAALWLLLLVHFHFSAEIVILQDNDIINERLPVSKNSNRELCQEVKAAFGIRHGANSRPDLAGIRMDLLHEEGMLMFSLEAAGQAIPRSRYYNSSAPLAVFLHGFMSSAMSAAPRAVGTALLQHGSLNVVLMDSGSIIASHYLASSSNVRYIGEALGAVLASMVTNSDYVKGENIHLIGHSLGAHIASFAAKSFRRLTGRKIGRISGLDPAAPCFVNVGKDRLRRGDAEFVDVIHSNRGVFGLIEPLGDADFFPNDGFLQPGCQELGCSHARSWEFYAESINRPRSFVAVSCPDWLLFISGACRNRPVEYMGYMVRTKARGLFYLKTAGQKPYGLGVRGTKPF